MANGSQANLGLVPIRIASTDPGVPANRTKPTGTSGG